MLGIDVNETKTVKFKDAEFVVGVLPYKIKVRLTALSMEYANEHKKEGGIQADPEKMEKFMQEQLGYIKYGVKDHKNIKSREGKEIPCKKNEDGTIHDDTLNTYLSSGIVPFLFTEIYQFNNLSEDEVKN